MENSKKIFTYKYKEPEPFDVSEAQEKMRKNLAEIERYINTFQKGEGEFKFPNEFISMALEKPNRYMRFAIDSENQFLQYPLFFSKDFYEFEMNHLSNNYREVDYVPFGRQYDSTNIICFFLDNRMNKQVTIINPFWPYKPDVKGVYDDFASWRKTLMD